MASATRSISTTITCAPDTCGGDPCVRGMRIPVRIVLEYLADGAGGDEILAHYPDLTLDDVAVAAGLLRAAQRALDR